MDQEGLRARLFGELGLITPDDREQPLGGPNLRALLVFLLTDARGTADRDKLAGLLWPDTSRARRLNSLRVALSHLEKRLSALHPGPYLRRDNHRVGLVPEAPLASDWDTLRRAADGEVVDEGALPGAPPLPDIEPPSDVFEEWLAVTRQRLQVTQMAALERSARQALTGGTAARGRRLAEKFLALDPLNEEGHRLLARALAAGSAPGAAVAQLEGCRDLLDRHLGAEPEPETEGALRALSDQATTNAPPLAIPEARDPLSWFPPVQRQKLDHFFAIFDEDGDGVVTRASFAAKAESLRTPFRLGRGDARLAALEQALADWWQDLALFAREDDPGAVDRYGWFRWFWWVQQRMGEQAGAGEPPASGSEAGPALFRLADRDGDGRQREQDFCGWLSAWTPHLALDPVRSFRALTGDRRAITLHEAMTAGAQFKFSAMPARGDALFGLTNAE